MITSAEDQYCALRRRTKDQRAAPHDNTDMCKLLLQVGEGEGRNGSRSVLDRFVYVGVCLNELSDIALSAAFAHYLYFSSLPFQALRKRDRMHQDLYKHIE